MADLQKMYNKAKCNLWKDFIFLSADSSAGDYAVDQSGPKMNSSI